MWLSVEEQLHRHYSSLENGQLYVYQLSEKPAELCLAYCCGKFREFQTTSVLTGMKSTCRQSQLHAILSCKGEGRKKVVY